MTLVLSFGPPLLARLVSKAGLVYGSFATVAGMFALLYLVSQALVYSAEAAAVRWAPACGRGPWTRTGPPPPTSEPSPSSPASKSAYRPPGSTSALSPRMYPPPTAADRNRTAHSGSPTRGSRRDSHGLRSDYMPRVA